MNLQCAFLHLAVISPPVVPRSETPDEEDAPRAANDNQTVWPLMPFPEDWCASS
jgi:hypothetical protein